MKKLLILFVCLFTLQTIARADDDKPIQVSQMPQKAQQFIKQHFAGNNIAMAKVAGNNIAMAKVESDFLQKSYDVIFTDGNKVEFDKKGNWTEVNCKFSVVPQGIIPAPIQKYVTTNYADAKILKIERDKADYEVKLSNGWELKFDSKFNLIDIDN